MADEEFCLYRLNQPYPNDGYMSFYTIHSLVELELPYNVLLNEGEISSLNNLRKITCHATTAPSITLVTSSQAPTPTFYNLPRNGILRIPRGSDYSL